MKDILHGVIELENPIDMIVGVYHGNMKYAKHKKPTVYKNGFGDKGKWYILSNESWFLNLLISMVIGRPIGTIYEMRGF